MKLWVWVLLFGAAGCGWLLLKARRNDIAAIRRKIGGGTRSLRKAAAQAAKGAGASPIKPIDVLRAEQPVTMSKSLPSHIAKELEGLQR